MRNALVLCALGVTLVCCGLESAPALAVVPSPPPGAPAVESAPSSLVGLDPQLPAGVVSASAAPGSHWQPEKAVYGTGSTDEIKVKGADGTTIRVNEIYPTLRGQLAKLAGGVYTIDRSAADPSSLTLELLG